MIDKILDFKDNMHENLYEELFNEATKNNDARILFMMAYYIKNANIAKLSEAILKTDNLRYILFFMRSIPNINKDIFLNKVLSLATPKDAYYCMFDNRDLTDEQIIKLMSKIEGDIKYYFLSIYLYFIVFNKFNLNIFNKAKSMASFMNISIDENNYKEVLMHLKAEKFKEILPNIPKGFTNNCYIGRKDYIPDMIVLHSTASFEKGIEDFYDESKEVSAHFIINIDGQVKQLVSLDDSAWANGTSLNQESDVYYRFANSEIVKSRNYNANYYTFSIEHVSFDGELTEAQITSSKKVIKEIITYVEKKYNYKFKIDKEHIITHRDINPIVRTICPGLQFPIDKIIKELKEEI